jgi:hypothetical protein
MPRVAKGCVEQLPSGSWRARVYAWIDPITKREIRFKATAKTEQQAHIELGRLLKEASEGRTPESDATVAELLDEYAAIASWDVSTRQTNEGFIRPTIKPPLGPMKVRKVRGPFSRSCTRSSSAAATCPALAGRSSSTATSRSWRSIHATPARPGSRSLSADFRAAFLTLVRSGPAGALVGFELRVRRLFVEIDPQESGHV